MTAYKKLKECKSSAVLSEEEYKEKFDVYNTWIEIEKNIIDTWSLPQYNNGSYDKHDIILNRVNSPYIGNGRDAMINSLKYMFYRFGKFYYVRIRNNVLEIFAYIDNSNYKNPVAHKIILGDDAENTLKYIKKDIKKVNLEKAEIFGSVIKFGFRIYEDYDIDFYYHETKYLFNQLLKKYRINDSDFIINHKDRVVLKKDLTEPNEEIVGSISYPLNDHKYNTYLPILGYCYSDTYLDIPLITPDDIRRIEKIYVPNNCKESIYFDQKINTNWTTKIPVAVFRGSFTGYDYRMEYNQRLYASFISKNMINTLDKNGYPYLDVGITNFRGAKRPRKPIDVDKAHIVNRKWIHYLYADHMSHSEQSNYKYILYIEGNVAAYRGAFLFSMASVVLWVRPTKCKLWFEDKLEDYVHCIFIESDLSNLISVIIWLKNNDEKAIKIAQNGYNFYKQYLTQEPLHKYCMSVLNSLSKN